MSFEDAIKEVRAWREYDEYHEKRNKFITERVIDNGKEGYAHICCHDIIDHIQEIRSRNNQNWMDLARLAFEVAPERAKAIMKKITEADSEINKLSKELSK